MGKTMSIYAEALMSNREFKSARINGESVGVTAARVWIAAVKAALVPAYAVYKYRFDHMGDAEKVAACDQSALYAALHTVLNFVGEVNGAKLNAHNIAENVISCAVRFRVIDTSEEMAHARLERKIARKRLNDDETPENQSAYDKWVDECARLEALPGNCKRIPEIQSEPTFVRDVELMLGAAILHQSLRPVEDILAEKAALKAARADKRKANKAAKK